jgi:MFS family permease
MQHGSSEAEASLPAGESALENQQLGSLQIRVAALCTLVQICDGYDIGSIGIAAPSLMHAWNLPGPAFTRAFLWSSIGIMAGALSAGPIGDYVGRKPLLVVSLTIFGLASLLSAAAGSLLALSILRFFTGVGIGGAFPGAATLTGDYAPQRLRICVSGRSGDGIARAVRNARRTVIHASLRKMIIRSSPRDSHPTPA